MDDEKMQARNFLPFAFGLAWLVTSNLSCSAVKNGVAPKFSRAENAQGDLWGKNMGDEIDFWWELHDGTSEYIIYRSTSANGPWHELGRMSDAVARTSGAKIDDTPDARKTTLCYKVEALDTRGVIIRFYEPMCVPKFPQTSQSQGVGKPRHAVNAPGTLYGENAGDFIILQWEVDDGAAEYRTYRSRSLAGPWQQVLRTSQGAASTGGAKQDFTPDARLMDLCYKVEAIDTKGIVIQTYEPICVPKFVR